MKLLKLTKQFRRDEDGAVTVDWVVLTAAIVGLGVAVLSTVRGGTEGVATNINSELESTTVDTSMGTE